MVAAGALPIAVVWSRWLVVGIVLVAGVPLVGAPAISAPVSLVIVGFALVAGVPHGAVDHLMTARLTGGTPIVFVVSVYAAVAAAAWALLRWAGPIAVVLVVVLSALHFGLGELEVSRQVTGWRPGPLSALAIVIAGSGALVLPMARSGDQLEAVATAVSPGLALLIGAGPVQIGLMLTWLVAAGVAVVVSLWSGHPGVALDIVLIGALGMVAPPLVAFAVWFGGWHALRHTARMLTVEPGCAALLANGRRRAAAQRFVRLAVLPSSAALTAVAALGWFSLAAPDPTAAVAEVLRLLLALTVPHMVVVLWLDRSADSDNNTPPPTRPSRINPSEVRIPPGAQWG